MASFAAVIKDLAQTEADLKIKGDKLQSVIMTTNGATDQPEQPAGKVLAALNAYEDALQEKVYVENEIEGMTAREICLGTQSMLEQSQKALDDAAAENAALRDLVTRLQDTVAKKTLYKAGLDHNDMQERASDLNYRLRQKALTVAAAGSWEQDLVERIGELEEDLANMSQELATTKDELAVQRTLTDMLQDRVDIYERDSDLDSESGEEALEEAAVVVAENIESSPSSFTTGHRSPKRSTQSAVEFDMSPAAKRQRFSVSLSEEEEENFKTAPDSKDFWRTLFEEGMEAKRLC
ncbi:hypothetical protein B0T26DRAFT_746209 [Lasiosphaeria miniovina]|uniref:Uncharacterized protein n=1 Tax=Lasiosphaeria miniovina TaxID=1954250 RepID=A0AA40BHD9_9PEZI|nr:uncharacterized protein B0T26DRAFT_746209 [Lasiosphaeria miniovina]KAK0734280.1 hypothetical protein B0T26DRAFT_746209 [Lasiosphaeria miniovina]